MQLMTGHKSIECEHDFLALIPGLTALKVSSGHYHVCALLSNGKIACWGMNNYGQLGIGSNHNVGDTVTYMGSKFELVLLGTGVSCSCHLKSM
jgi:alpha-tubulin suppressor-like RCC1 family protein